MTARLACLAAFKTDFASSALRSVKTLSSSLPSTGEFVDRTTRRNQYRVIAQRVVFTIGNLLRFHIQLCDFWH